MRAGNFENGMRNVGLADVSLVSGVEEQKRLVLPRVIHPASQLFTRRHRAGRIVWKAKIDEIRMLVRRISHKIIFCPAWQINEPLVTAVLPQAARYGRP